MKTYQAPKAEWILLHASEAVLALTEGSGEAGAFMDLDDFWSENNT